MKYHYSKPAIRFCLPFLLLTGCDFGTKEKDINDNTPITEAYILKTDSTIDNNNDLSSIQLVLKKNQEKISNVFSDDPNSDDSNENESAKKVMLKEAVARLFDPELHPCPLPNKVKNKLQKLKESQKKGWAPKYVQEQISQKPDSALFIPGKSLSYLLHSVKVIHANSTSFPWTVMGSPTFRNLNFENFILTTGENSFSYTLDCSGYMNAAIEGAGVAPGADIASKAATSLAKENSMFIGGGVLLSPLFAAVYPEQTGVELDTLERIKILKSLVSIPGVADDDIIDIPLFYDVIWASKDGGSSFNGKGDFSAKGSGGIGFAQISGSASAGAEVTRKSTFKSFETYLISSRPNKSPEKIKILNVKKIIEQLQRPTSI